MIIQIAGAHGSGKSTLMRRLLEQPDCSPVVVDERLVGYRLRLSGVSRETYVVGPYEAPSGGCDVLRTLDEAYGLIRRAVRSRQHVLFEGASHTMNQTRGPALVGELGGLFVVVLLTTPLGVCLEGIAVRRAERGVPPLVDTQYVRGSYGRAQNYAARMRDAGAQVVRCSRDEAPALVLELLRQGS